jgi:chromosome segregation ATPase
MSNPDFLTNFDESLKNLQGLVENRAQTSGEYNDMVLSKIRTIDEKLGMLRDKAKEVAELVKRLKGYLRDKGGDLKQNRLQIKQLTDDLGRIEREKAELQQEIQNLTSKSGADVQQIQQQLDQARAEIDRLNKQVEDREREVLNQQQMQGEELNAKNQEQLQQHSQEIAALNQQIEALNGQVQQKENEMQQLIENTRKATDQHLEEIEGLKMGSQDVNSKINELTQQNNALVQKIIDATNIINVALREMVVLKDRNRNQNSAAIDAKIAETNQLIQEIYDILNGSSGDVPPENFEVGDVYERPETGENGGPSIELNPMTSEQRRFVGRPREELMANYKNPRNPLVPRGGKKTKKNKKYGMKKMNGGFIAIYDNTKSRIKTKTTKKAYYDNSPTPKGIRARGNLHRTPS